MTDMTGARPMTEPSQFPPSQPAPPYPYAPYPPPFNTYAILSLVFAVFVFAPLGIYFGQVAKRQIAQTGERGIELANVGIICGWIFSVLIVIWCGFFASVASTGELCVSPSLMQIVALMPSSPSLAPQPPPIVLTRSAWCPAIVRSGAACETARKIVSTTVIG